MRAATSRIAASPKSAAETSIPNSPPNSTVLWATRCGALTLTAPLPPVATRPHVMKNRNAA